MTLVSEANTQTAKTAVAFDQQKLTLLLTGKVIEPSAGGRDATSLRKPAVLARYGGDVTLQTRLGMVTLRDAPRLTAGQVFQPVLSPWVRPNKLLVVMGGLTFHGGICGAGGQCARDLTVSAVITDIRGFAAKSAPSHQRGFAKADQQLGKASLWLANLQKQGRGAAVLSAAQRQSLLEDQPQLAQQIISELGNLRPQICRLWRMAVRGSSWFLPLFGGAQQMQDMTHIGRNAVVLAKAPAKGNGSSTFHYRNFFYEIWPDAVRRAVSKKG